MIENANIIDVETASHPRSVISEISGLIYSCNPNQPPFSASHVARFSSIISAVPSTIGCR